jgi:hypothetical protein
VLAEAVGVSQDEMTCDVIVRKELRHGWLCDMSASKARRQGEQDNCRGSQPGLLLFN